MTSNSAASDQHREQMIIRAERRREMLERLSAVGMMAAERLAHRAWAPEVGDEAAHNGLAFAKVSRAVRLTVILEAKIDEQILALCNGLTPMAVAWLEPAVRSARPRVSKDGVTKDHEAIEPRSEGEPREEREFDRLLAGGFEACVSAIREDLGLDPDWSRWTEEEGVVPEAEGSGYRGRKSWTRASERKRETIPSPLVGEGVGAADG